MNKVKKIFSICWALLVSVVEKEAALRAKLRLKSEFRTRRRLKYRS